MGSNWGIRGKVKKEKMIQTELLTNDEILDFQRICREVKGMVLTYEEAKEQALRLVQAFDLLLDNKLTIASDNKN